MTGLNLPTSISPRMKFSPSVFSIDIAEVALLPPTIDVHDRCRSSGAVKTVERYTPFFASEPLQRENELLATVSKMMS
ncbi:hypothetical protein BE15_41795 [Sorangium cellulosum]|uniref:Uncharacterized protein n=1 Tax=Sorangium cellulosum TaxID=56 RepID=A0A150QYF3_SORCE|nr:hypothetical protein [Sorangium cellulosum]KYF72942.1 hypothetical protein BE15_41795 [Sorangium cellulosum]